MKALKEIGFSGLINYLGEILFNLVFNMLLVSPLKIIWLKLWGSKIGANVIVNKISFLNIYRGGLKNLSIANNCFLSDGVLLDLADKITLEDDVTLAVRSLILTHTNVGYKDHPLQKHFPSFTKKVILKSGCFIGAHSVILPGLTIGRRAFVAAGAVVTKDVSENTVVAGVSAKNIKNIR